LDASTHFDGTAPPPTYPKGELDPPSRPVSAGSDAPALPPLARTGKVHPAFKVPPPKSPIKLDRLEAPHAAPDWYDIGDNGSFPPRPDLYGDGGELPPRQDGEGGEEPAPEPPGGPEDATPLEWVAARGDTSSRQPRKDEFAVKGGSSLPLEAYDPLDADDALDFPAMIAEEQARGAPGIPARCRFFTNDGQFYWAPCHATAFHADARQFDIRWVHSGKEKLRVKRLNVCLDAEEPAALSARIRAARREKAEVEARARYQEFLDSIPFEHRDIMDDEFEQRVMALANWDLATALPGVVDDCLEELRDVYRHSIKQSVMRHKLSDPELAKDLADVLAIAPLPRAPPVPASGVAPCPDVGAVAHWQGGSVHCEMTDRELFSVLQADVKSTLPQAQQTYLSGLQSFHSELDVSGDRLVDTSLSLLELPAALDDLHDYWVHSVHEAMEGLKTTWVLRVLRELDDVAVALRPAENPLMEELERREPVSTASAVASSAQLSRYVKMVSLKMADQVQVAVVQSARALVDVLRGYDFEEGSREARAGRPDTDDGKWGADLFTTVPTQLLRIRLCYSTEQRSLELTPGVDEITSKLLSVFEEIFLQSEGVEDVSAKLALAQDNTTLPTVDLADPRVSELKRQLLAVVEKNLQGPLDLLAAFGAIRDLVEVDEEAFLEDWRAREHTLEESLAEVTKFDGLIQTVFDRCEACVNFAMVSVDCSAAKASLHEKASVIRIGLLHDIARRWTDANREIAATYDHMCTTLSQQPTDPEMLDELNTFLEETEGQLESLAERIDESREAYESLDAKTFVIEDAQSALYFELLNCPLRLTDVVLKWKARAAKARIAYMDQLRDDMKALTEKLAGLEKEVNEFVKLGDLSAVEDRALQVLDIQQTHANLKELAELYQSREAIFGLKETEWPILDQISKVFDPTAKLWELCASFSRDRPDWQDGPFKEIDAEMVAAKVDEWYRQSGKLTKLLVGPPASVVLETRKLLEEFMDKIPLITAVCNPGMQTRHWRAISEIVGREVKMEDEFTLSIALSMGLGDHLDQIQEVSENASKEFSLEKALRKMEGEWTGIEFEFGMWRDTGTYKLRALDDIQMLLDDHIVKTQSMRASPFIGPHEEAVKLWESKLGMTQDIIDQWIKCQDGWLYLEPIFGSEDIMQQMPTEGAKFKMVDLSWRDIMEKAVKNPEVLAVTADPEMLAALLEANQLLDQVQRGLNEYLETKRVAFPRFYFLADPELLAILSETKDPTRVQPYMSKCFEGILALEFDKNMVVQGMQSAEGEVVALQPFEPAKANGAVERWLIECEASMKASVKKEMLSATEAYESTERTKWILDWPGQVVLGIDCLFWTQETALAIAEGTLSEYASKCTEELMKVVAKVRGDLTKLQRMTLSALIVIDVHARDVVLELSKQGVTSETEFEWISQLRYNWEDGDLVVRMINAALEYGYEYLGNSSRLVITPLTDRCYRTLMGALHLNFGGAPEGPAGTGKTETTKDLAKAMAMQCVVFNCSDQMEYQAMGKMFKGLASAGSWACFDEFNRINLEVLSVIAQQILTIQRAKAQRKKLFDFEGSKITLKQSCNVFITMNPGYAGRSELPDNLKALFRSVAMMVPDYALISEIILYSAGYEGARDLARKLVATYRLCSEQLSSQKHYDYGMRAVMSVLRAATANKQKKELASLSEDVMMLRSIQDVNLPKFLAPDIPLFNGILSDLFPGVELPAPDYEKLELAVRDSCEAANLQPTDVFLEKLFQLYEMILVRHGLMIVGYSFGAKTSLYRMLAAALGLLEQRKQLGEVKVQTHIMNPKAVYIDQLYGAPDKISKEWKDGVLATEFRNAYKAGVGPDAVKDRQWVILDGPVDAVWIENMNTVLDDNKKLCLNSGETISMTPQMNMIFEVQDLLQASPATVSRCGMVYVEPSSMGWEPLVVSWLNQAPESLKPSAPRITELFKWFVDPCTAFIRRNCREPVQTLSIGLVSWLMRFFDAMSPMFREEGAKAPSAKDTPRLVDGIFLMSAIWSLGATVDAAGRPVFSTFFRALAEGVVDAKPDRKDYDLGPGVEVAYPDSGAKLNVHLPADGLVFDFLFDTDKMQWKHWLDTTKVEPPSEKTPFNSLVITTVDTVRYSFIFDTLTTAGKSCLFVGPTGTGKTVYVQSRLNQMDRAKYMNVQTAFSAQTNANQIQDIIDMKLKQRRKHVLGPPIGLKCVIFVDDLNMPTPETYGAQPPIELLRQFCDHQGWYNRNENTFTNLVDIQLCSAMGPPGGGRNEVTPRLLRHFNVISVTEFTDETYLSIYSSIIDWWFRRAKAPDEVRAKGSAIVRATVSIYNTVRAELLPTPAKSHYLYNMRDLSKVFQGMQMCGVPLTDARGLSRLWVHECLRVFHDRLISDEDRLWFCQLVKDSVDNVLGQKFDKVFEQADGSAPELTDLRKLMYCDFQVPNADPKKYDEVASLSELLKVIEDYLSSYNSDHKTRMDLVLFQYAAEHICRISRVIKQPYGNCMLVGVGGSGRQSLTRIAAYMAEYKLESIEITKSYSMGEWRDDLKRILTQAGGDDKQTVFMLADTQIKQEAFLEDINNILNTGEVPNLFAKDEIAALTEKVTKKAKAEGRPLGMEELYAYFVEQCRENLHIVLAFSPVGEAFRVRIRKFPSLVNCCSINWFQEWPSDALKAVAKQFMRDVDFDTEEVRDAVEDMCMSIHVSVRSLAEKFKNDLGRFYYTTPTSYLELISMYKTLLHAERLKVSKLQTRYEIGLEKVMTAEKDVNVMKQELIDLQPKLEATSKEVEATLEVVNRETAAAEVTKAAVKKDEAIASEKAAAAKIIKDDCEGELAKAMPALNAALREVDKLSKGDIQEVKAMKNPPLPVKSVMEAVCILFGQKATRINDPDNPGKKRDDYWSVSLSLLAQMDFIQQLKQYDKENIEEATINKIEPYLEKDEFQPEAVKKSSKAAYGISQWVRAMHTYFYVSRDVAPKRAALKGAEDELKEVNEALAIKMAELKGVEEKIANLNDTLRANLEEKDRLEKEAALCQKKLERAGKLINGLGGEKIRWGEICKKLSEDYGNLTGDIILSAGFIAYLGAFTSEYRSLAVTEWLALCRAAAIPCTEKYSLQTVMGEPVKIRSWVIDGLPNDTFSIENAITMRTARRWPLLIDPQGQANKWIRNMEASQQLHVIKLTDKNFVRTLENCINLGNPVLLENVGTELDPTLEPLLLRSVYKESGTLRIKLGDKPIDYSDTFRFYITTKLRNPHYLPEIAVKVTLLNFMITPTGLEDQLLGLVVQRERPELQEKKEELVVQAAAATKQLKEIEDQIIEVLSSSEGNILEDETAINIITVAKTKSNEIAKQQEEAKKTEEDIDRNRRGYVPVAKHTSSLFFCVSDLSFIESMYQYSLSWFIGLFEGTIRVADKPTAPTDAQRLQARIDSLLEHFTYSLYKMICRSLFEKDKLLFSFLLTVTLESKIHNRIDAAEYRFLLTGGLSTADPPPKPAPWLPTKQWGELVRLGNVSESFAGLAEHFEANVDAWKAMYDSPSPVEHPLPGTWADKLDAFQRLLVMRVIRPDKLTFLVRSYVEGVMGAPFVDPPPFILEACFNDSNSLSPLIFVLSPGADPMTPILKLAERLGIRTESISLGQGQGPQAEKLITSGRAEGFWVVLQNCHLAESWMPVLERICENISPDSTDSRFRLWLTSYPSDHFPVAVLQNGIKMTSDPPKGLRANLFQSYISDPVSEPDFFEGCDRPVEFKRLLYGLCFFHAVIQERLKFGPLGWNVSYQFSVPDFIISVRQLQMFLNEYADTLPLKILTYLTGECNYGGRVTDAKDRRTMESLLRIYYSEGVVTDEGYRFSPSGNYVVPPDGAHDEYLDFIKGLPAIAEPEVFGLHANADISKDQQETDLFTDSALKTQSHSTGGAGGSKEAVLDDIAADTLARVPLPFDIEAARYKFPVDYHESMNTVLTQELVRLNWLIEVIHSTLTDLRKAIKGLVVMSADLEAVANAMFDGKVPAVWMAKSYPSIKPLASYVNDLIERIRMFQSWIDDGAPVVFWMSGFFFTHAFLTGVKQNFARKGKIPIDTIGWVFQCLKPELPGSKPADGAYVRGLFLEGAKWDYDLMALAESDPKVLYSDAPLLWLQPAVDDGSAPPPHYECPLYVTTERKGVLQTTGHSSNFVMDVRLPSDRPQDHWIRRGVALMLSLPD